MKDKKDIEKMDIIEILNQINKMPDETLLERMITWCQEFNYDPQELGDLLGESEQLKRTLWMNAVKHNQILDPLLKQKWDQMENLGDW